MMPSSAPPGSLAASRMVIRLPSMCPSRMRNAAAASESEQLHARVIGHVHRDADEADGDQAHGATLCVFVRVVIGRLLEKPPGNDQRAAHLDHGVQSEAHKRNRSSDKAAHDRDHCLQAVPADRQCGQRPRPTAQALFMGGRY
jgi:hypothetical protein